MIPNVAVKTICNILTEERKNFLASSGEHYKSKPTLAAMDRHAGNETDPNILIPEEVNGAGRPFIFPTNLYDTLKKRLMLFKNRTGIVLIHTTYA